MTDKHDGIIGRTIGKAIIRNDEIRMANDESNPNDEIRNPKQWRFVVLLHEGHGERHYDLFLEVPGRERLMAWHVLRGPEEWGKVKELGAKRIGDHRKVYMEYEGKVSGGRGTVQRIAAGVAKVVEMNEKEMRVRLGNDEMALPMGEGGKKRILVTGAAGVIGGIVCRTMKEAGHFVRGLDIREAKGVDEMVTGTVADAQVVKRAMAGMEVLIHLAATTDDADFMTELLPNNVVGMVNVLEAAREAGVKRMVLASSVQVAGGWPAEPRVVRVSDGACPWNGYAATKIFAEVMGHVYFARHKMEVVCARIGSLPRNVESGRCHCDGFARGVFLSHDDAGRFFRCCVEVEKIGGVDGGKPGYAVVYVTSRRETVEGLSAEEAKEAVGYEAQDFYPAGLPTEWGL